MTEQAEEFATLLERVRQGDENAVRAMVLRYEGVIRRAARGLLGQALRPHLDSMDLVQSVHRSLLIGLRYEKFEISSPEKLIALALTLVRRKVARQWRRIKRQHVHGAGAAGETAQVSDSHPSPQADPAGDAQYQDAMRHLLSDLDEVDRRLIELRLQGYSTAEVARQMDIDSRFLRVRLGRLRKRLRDRGVLSEWL
jgi:RNA polymerase sigma-70 factor (ECF subfamily)